VQVGAEMSDTARAILSYKGVLHKNHLLNGVKKGALTADDVETKFAQWLADKDSKITGKKDGLAKNEAADKAARLKAEVLANETRAKAVELKNAPVVEEEIAEEAPVAEEVMEETPVAEESPVTEEVAVEETPEAAVEEAPVAETPAEEAGEEEKTAE
jgi:small subunit ribosomal protein S16